MRLLYEFTVSHVYRFNVVEPSDAYTVADPSADFCVQQLLEENTCW